MHRRKKFLAIFNDRRICSTKACLLRFSDITVLDAIEFSGFLCFLFFLHIRHIAIILILPLNNLNNLFNILFTTLIWVNKQTCMSGVGIPVCRYSSIIIRSNSSNNCSNFDWTTLIHMLTKDSPTIINPNIMNMSSELVGVTSPEISHSVGHSTG